MMEELDELRPPTAWRLLEIWRGTRELAEEPLERALLCNAQVLSLIHISEPPRHGAIGGGGWGV